MKTIITILSCLTLTLFMPYEVNAQQTTASTQSFTVSVKGVGCNEDVKSIAANVEKLEGVLTCSPQKRGATTKFQVSFDPNKISKSQIYDAVEDTPGCTNPKARPYKVKNKD